MWGLMSGPAACGETSISASAANAGRSPATRPAVAQAVARRRFRRFICYAMLAIANGARWIRRCPHGAQSYAGTWHAHGKTGPIFRYRGSLRARLIAAVNWVALAMRWAKCRYLGIPFTQPFALPAVGGAVPLARAGAPRPPAGRGGRGLRAGEGARPTPLRSRPQAESSRYPHVGICRSSMACRIHGWRPWPGG